MDLSIDDFGFLNELIYEKNFEMFLHNEDKYFQKLNLFDFWQYLEARLFLIWFKKMYKPNCKIKTKTLYLFNLHQENLKNILLKVQQNSKLSDYNFFREEDYKKDYQKQLKLY